MTRLSASAGSSPSGLSNMLTRGGGTAGTDLAPSDWCCRTSLRENVRVSNVIEWVIESIWIVQGIEENCALCGREQYRCREYRGRCDRNTFSCRTTRSWSDATPGLRWNRKRKPDVNNSTTVGWYGCKSRSTQIESQSIISAYSRHCRIRCKFLYQHDATGMIPQLVWHQ